MTCLCYISQKSKGCLGVLEWKELEIREMVPLLLRDMPFNLEV